MIQQDGIKLCFNRSSAIIGTREYTGALIYEFYSFLAGADVPVSVLSPGVFWFVFCLFISLIIF